MTGCKGRLVAISLHGGIQKSDYPISSRILSIEGFHYSYNRPDCYKESDVTWQKIVLSLELDGEEIWNQTEFDAATRGDSTLTGEGGSRGRGKFQIDLKGLDNDRSGNLELKLTASMSNGVSARTVLHRWYLDKDGALKAPKS